MGRSFLTLKISESRVPVSSKLVKQEPQLLNESCSCLITN